MPTNNLGHYITHSGYVHAPNTWLIQHGFPARVGALLSPALIPTIYAGPDSDTVIQQGSIQLNPTPPPAPQSQPQSQPEPSWGLSPANAPHWAPTMTASGIHSGQEPIYENEMKRDTRKNKNKLYNIPLMDAFQGRIKAKRQKGEIGLEIECEGLNLVTAMVDYWLCHQDNSLRAVKDHMPQEYVLRHPIDRKEVPKALKYLNAKLRDAGSELVYSHRTSVHVHVNCQTLTIKEICQFWCLYTIFEEILVAFSGPDRPGNLFCLTSKQAEYQVKVFEDAIRQDNYTELFNDNIRYTSGNLASLGKFGSFEFRSMRGTVDEKLIQTWVDILLVLKDQALTYSDPQEIVKDFQRLNAEAFLRQTFSSRPDLLVIFQAYPDRHKILWDGLRLMRDVAYAIPTWEKRDKELEKVKDTKEDKGSGTWVSTWSGMNVHTPLTDDGSVSVMVDGANVAYLCNFATHPQIVSWMDISWDLSPRRWYPVSLTGGSNGNGGAMTPGTTAPVYMNNW